MLVEKEVRPAIGVGVLVWRGQQLLLGERIDNAQDTYWQFPGGHLEAGETVTLCAEREVLEETGLVVNGLRHYGFTDRSFIAGDNRYITLLVSCEYLSGEARVLEPDRCKSWQWFEYKHLPAPLFTPIEILLSQYDDLYVLHRQSIILSDDYTLENESK